MDIKPQPEQKPLTRMFDATEPYHKRKFSDPAPISNKEARKEKQKEERRDDYVKIKRSPRAEMSYFQAFKEWINL